MSPAVKVSKLIKSKVRLKLSIDLKLHLANKVRRMLENCMGLSNSGIIHCCKSNSITFNLHAIAQLKQKNSAVMLGLEMMKEVASLNGNVAYLNGQTTSVQMISNTSNMLQPYPKKTNCKHWASVQGQVVHPQDTPSSVSILCFPACKLLHSERKGVRTSAAGSRNLNRPPRT